MAPGLLVMGVQLVGHFDLVDALLSFGIAFVVPLTLLRVGAITSPIPVVVPGVIAIGGLLLPRGTLAATTALPWLVLAIWFAVKAGLALLKVLNLGTILRAAAFVYLLVGAAWLVISQNGARPTGLSEDIVELTAVHFTFAGFTATLLALETARRLQGRQARLTLATGAGVVASMPIVAAGFYLDTIVSVTGATLLALSLWTLGALMIPAGRVLGGASEGLLVVAALSVLVSMVLALHFAAAPLIDLQQLSIPAMARLHGAANALGFAGCATLAFTSSLCGLR